MWPTTICMVVRSSGPPPLTRFSPSFDAFVKLLMGHHASSHLIELLKSYSELAEEDDDEMEARGSSASGFSRTPPSRSPPAPSVSQPKPPLSPERVLLT